MKVIAVDVGLRVTGYVVCSVHNSYVELCDNGQIATTTQSPLSQRLYKIYEGLVNVIERHKPQVLIVEKLYSHYKHPVTLGVLAQVRGVVLLLAEQYRLTLYEFSPTRARKALLGKGSARAPQVKKMVENVLKRKIKSQHIADAFSLVVAFAHTQKDHLLSELKTVKL
jgi:crossover junction endodeoxyribonuclease RuvC